MAKAATNQFEASPPVALVIDQKGSYISGNIRTQHLFGSVEDATKAFDAVTAASKAYAARANDREEMVRFTCLTGVVAVNVTEIAAVSVDNALGENRAAVEAWNAGIAEIFGKADAAKKAVGGTDAPA